MNSKKKKRVISLKISNKPLSNKFKRITNYASIIGTFLTLLIGFITFWLMIKYSENKEEIKNLTDIVEELRDQKELIQNQLTEVGKQTQIALQHGEVLDAQLDIAHHQLKKIEFQDSIDRRKNIMKFSNNFNSLIIASVLLKDTTETRRWDPNRRKQLLTNIFDNLNEGLFNPILIEDGISFQEWNSALLQVSGVLSLYYEEKDVIHFTIPSLTQEQLDRHNQDGLIEVLKTCKQLSNIIFKRIICKYKYNAAC